LCQPLSISAVAALIRKRPPRRQVSSPWAKRIERAMGDLEQFVLSHTDQSNCDRLTLEGASGADEKAIALHVTKHGETRHYQLCTVAHQLRDSF